MLATQRSESKLSRVARRWDGVASSLQVFVQMQSPQKSCCCKVQRGAQAQHVGLEIRHGGAFDYVQFITGQATDAIVLLSYTDYDDIGELLAAGKGCDRMPVVPCKGYSPMYLIILKP